MRRPEVALIDFGVGNLLSVQRALEYCGANANVTADRAEILAADRVVLPGVGAFASGMAELRRLGLDDVVKEVAAKGRPLLAICLGMQFLLDVSEEFGETPGLGLIPGRVIAVPPATADGGTQKVPHIGWNALVASKHTETWAATLLEDIQPGEAMYFVHSFMATPADPAHRVADCLYGGVRIPAAIGLGSVFGCQFHPEKSGTVGLRMLRRFLR